LFIDTACHDTPIIRVLWDIQSYDYMTLTPPLPVAGLLNVDRYCLKRPRRTMQERRSSCIALIQTLCVFICVHVFSSEHRYPRSIGLQLQVPMIMPGVDKMCLSWRRFRMPLRYLSTWPSIPIYTHTQTHPYIRPC
jgi:hypothetical protein